MNGTMDRLSEGQASFSLTVLKTAVRIGRQAGSALALPVATSLAALSVWEVVARLELVHRFLLPPPTEVVRESFLLREFLLRQSWVTFQEAILGFALAVAISLPLAVVISSSRRLEDAIYPLIVVSQVVPKVALAPLLFIWVGFGIESKVVIAMLICFFPLLIDSVVGFKSLEIEKVYLARSMGAGWWKTLWRIRFPNALPNIMGGLKLAITFALVGAVVGEFVGADAGLGKLMMTATRRLDSTLMFAGILYITIMGVAMFMAIHALERLVIPWHVSQRIELLKQA